MPKIKRKLRKILADPDRMIAYIVLAAIGSVMLWTIWPSLSSEGFLAAWDAGGHLLKAEYFADHILAHGWIDGWFPTWHGGFGLFQYYPPLLYYFLGALTYVFESELALRIFTAALWVGLLPATYYLLRSFDLSRIYAALGCGLLLSLNASFGVGLGALYGVGLLPNGLGFILAIWALGRLKRDLFDLRPARKVLLTGIVFGLLVLAHTFSTYWFILISLLLAATAIWHKPADVRKAALKRYGLVLGIGFAISAFWWVPLLGSFSGMGETGAIQQATTGQILEGLLLSKDSGGWVLSLLAAFGLAYLAACGRYRELAFWGGAAVLTLLLSINAINGLLPFGNVVGSSQFIRFHAFFALIVMVLGALGIAGAWHFADRLGKEWQATGMAALMIGFVALTFLVIKPTLDDKAGFIRIVQNEPTSELEQLGAQLRKRLRPGDFVISEFNWESRYFLGSPHFVNQRLPHHVPGLWDLDGNFPEGTQGSERPVLIASTLPRSAFLSEQPGYLASRGVRYVISTYPATQDSLDLQPWLKPAWKGSILSLYEVVGYDRKFGLPERASKQLDRVSYAKGVYRLEFGREVSLEPLTTTALSYHPWLKVMADGEEVGTSNSSDQLAIADPVQAREITIAYEPPAWVRGSWLISILALLALAGLITRRDRITRWLSARVQARGRRPL